MKIAVFVDHFPSLTQTFVLQQIAGLATKGYQVTIFTQSAGQKPERHIPLIDDNNLMENVVLLPPKPKSYAKKIPVLIRLLTTYKGLRTFVSFLSHNKFKDVLIPLDQISLLSTALFLSRQSCQFDIIHCQFGKLGAHVERLRTLGAIKGKIATSFRGYDTEKHLRSNPNDYLRLMQNGDAFLPVCKYFSYWLQQQGCSTERIHIMRSGIDVRKFSYKPSAFPTANTINIIAIGRMVEKKGLNYLIEAIALLAGTSSRHYHLTLIGDGPLKKTYQTKIQQLDIETHVVMTGSCTHDEVLDLLQKAHLMVTPSVTADDGDQEGIPNVAKEAMALGLPVIATAHSGTPELIKHNSSGLLVEEKDAQGIADAIQTLLSDEITFKQIIENARRTIETEYDIDKLNEQLIQYFNTLAKS